MSLNRRHIIFPVSRDEFSTMLDFETFLTQTVPSQQRNGIYHIRTKLSYNPVGIVHPGSIVIFRMFGQHLGHAKVELGIRNQFDPNRLQLYPYYITFEPASVSLFPRKVNMNKFKQIFQNPFFTRAYVDITRQQYSAITQLAGINPIS